jgi:hypothetical protein
MLRPEIDFTLVLLIFASAVAFLAAIGLWIAAEIHRNRKRGNMEITWRESLHSINPPEPLRLKIASYKSQTDDPRASLIPSCLIEKSQLKPASSIEELASITEISSSVIREIANFNSTKPVQLMGYNSPLNCNEEEPVKGVYFPFNKQFNPELLVDWEVEERVPNLPRDKFAVFYGPQSGYKGGLCVIPKRDALDPLRIKPINDSERRIYAADYIRELSRWNKQWSLTVFEIHDDCIYLRFTKLPDDLEVFLTEDVWPLFPHSFQNRGQWDSVKKELAEEKETALNFRPQLY